MLRFQNQRHWQSMAKLRAATNHYFHFIFIHLHLSFLVYLIVIYSNVNILLNLTQTPNAQPRLPLPQITSATTTAGQTTEGQSV